MTHGFAAELPELNLHEHFRRTSEDLFRGIATAWVIEPWVSLRPEGSSPTPLVSGLASFLEISPPSAEGREVEALEFIGAKLRKGDTWGAIKINIQRIAVVPFRDPAHPEESRKFVPVDTGELNTARAFRAAIQVNYSGRVGGQEEIKYFVAEVPVMLRLSKDRSVVATCTGLDAFDAIAAMCESLGGTLDGEQCLLPKGADGEDSGTSRLSVSDPGKTKTPAL